MTIKYKFSSSAIVADPTLGSRQIRVIANSGRVDRVGDILVASGCKTENYNGVVLADHDTRTVIGNFKPVITHAVEGIITFAPAGISQKADEYCALYKAGVMNSVSVGFNQIEAEPIRGTGGILYKQWELLELSCVSVPCDPGAVVTARSAQKVGREISAANAAKLRQAHDHAESCRKIVAGVLGDEDSSDGATSDSELANVSARLKLQSDLIELTDDPVARRKRLEREHRLRMVETLRLQEAP